MIAAKDGVTRVFLQRVNIGDRAYAALLSALGGAVLIVAGPHCPCLTPP
jgi:hypothetical protein